MNGNSKEASPTASILDAVTTSSPLALAPIPASGWQDMCGGKKKKRKSGVKKQRVTRKKVRRVKQRVTRKKVKKARKDNCGSSKKKGSRKSKGQRRRRRSKKSGYGGKRKKGKKGKNGKRVYKFSGQKRLQIEYNIMIKRAIFRTQSCAGTNECRVLKYLKKWYNVNMFKVARIVKRTLNTMVTQGLLFRNKKNPVMFRVTLKGARLRSKLENRCRKKRKGKRGKGKSKKRGGKRKAKRRSIC